MDKIFRISTDSCSTDMQAPDADEAARRFAIDEQIPMVRGVADLKAYLRRVGGYGTMHGPDGDVLMRVPA